MITKRRRIGILAAGCLGIAVPATQADTPARPVGCNCRGGANVAADVGGMTSLSEPELFTASAGMGISPTFAGVAAFGTFPSPPEGTLGQTYQRTMIPVPADKHPRSGLIDIRAPGASSVSVQWTNQFRLDEELSGFVDANDSGLWHFEAPQLIPGVAQVYRVEARYGTGSACTIQERYVRLVMGRIVNVSL